MQMMSSRELHELIRDEHAACQFFQSKGILSTTWLCPKQCGTEYVRLKCSSDDDSEWIFKCSKCKRHRSLFAGTWMHGMRLSCLQVLDMLFSWIDTHSRRTLAREGRIRSFHTITDWSRFLRGICVESVEESSAEQIGGEGTIVEIDETLITRRKYNRGRALDQVWVFGAVERGTGKCFFQIVADRTERTLLEIIRERIKTGTTIISDMHRAYYNLSQYGYNHLTVNHSQNFVDPLTGAHTQTIESIWGALKQFLRRIGRNLGPHIEEYMAEFLYRRCYSDRLFEQFLEDVARYFPPRE